MCMYCYIGMIYVGYIFIQYHIFFSFILSGCIPLLVVKTVDIVLSATDEHLLKVDSVQYMA